MTERRGQQFERWWRRHKLTVITVLGIVLVVQFVLWLPFRSPDALDGSAKVGDFIGGFVGTLFGLLSAVLLYAALREQRRALRLQRQVTLRSSFENKYFALLEMHRDNVSEMQLDGAAGRRVFVVLLREFRAILELMRRVERKRGVLPPRQRFNVAYYHLFFGVGPNSARQLQQAFPQYSDPFCRDLSRWLMFKTVRNVAKRHHRFSHWPFEGHQSRLGHYYRHLYQTFRYIDAQRMPFGEKYEYAKTVRAQLSTHEQALLFVNSVSPIGAGWWKRGFMKQYKLVKNIPADFFDKTTEIDLKDTEYFGGMRYFEWEP